MTKSFLSLLPLLLVATNPVQAAEHGKYRNWTCFFSRGSISLTLTPACEETNGEDCANFWNDVTKKVTYGTPYQLSEDAESILITGTKFEMKLDKSTRGLMGNGKTPTIDGVISVRDVFGATLKDVAVGCNYEVDSQQAR